MAEARVLTKELIDLCLSRNNEKITEYCNKSIKDNPDGYKVFVWYENKPLKIVAETSFYDLDDELKERIYDNKISILTDDLLVNYAITKDTAVHYWDGEPHSGNKLKQYFFDNNLPITKGDLMLIKFSMLFGMVKDTDTDYRDRVPHYAKLISKDNAIVGCEIDYDGFNDWGREHPYVIADIDKNVKSIEEGAFNGVFGLVINYNGSVKDYLKIDVKEELRDKKHVVRCVDGTIEYVSVVHSPKATQGFMHDYSHNWNVYLMQVRDPEIGHDFWKYLEYSHLATISSHGYCCAPHFADVFDDDDNEMRYCLLDYHNFNMIEGFDSKDGFFAGPENEDSDSDDGFFAPPEK